MKLYKIFIYYYIIQLIYKISLSKKNNINNINNINDIFMIKHKEDNIHKYDKIYLKQNYKNFLLKKENLKIEKNIVKEKYEKVILSENHHSILLENNMLQYNFQSYKDFVYKINFKSNIKSNINDKHNVKNIKLNISDANKYFEYEFPNNNIQNYEFILDNNNFNDDTIITIKIMYYSECNSESNIELKELFIEITEKEMNNDDLSIIIFNMNKNYYPIYSNKKNIIDYSENNNMDLFFM